LSLELQDGLFIYYPVQ